MPRPTKRTPEVEAKICEVLRSGNTRRAACDYAGISQDSFGRWLESSADFADAIKKAEAHCEVRNVALIQKASEENWTAAAWWLERRRPDDWARKDKLQHEGGVKIAVSYEGDKANPAAAASGADIGSF